jgi:hypothetical protein
MLNQRNRPVVLAGIVLVVVWALAWGGYAVARNSKVTAEKVRAYLHDTDLGKLNAADRARALKRLSDQFNALSAEERRAARLDGEMRRWFTEMTEEERNEFIVDTLPTGFNQMLAAFEELPPDRRKKAIDDAMKRLREVRDDTAVSDGGPFSTRGGGRGPQLSEDMQKKVAAIGLKSYYTQSSAQTKAELAPLMEEIQRAMQSGRLFRPQR